ncbi:MAG: glycerol kinase, partial [Pseudomonadota bacterium]|nr:glycerol kinase [Pseudomonadota bacterium]
AMLAMVKLGWFDSLADFAAGWRPDAAFETSMPENQRAHKQRVWQAALKPVLRASESSGI